MNLKVFTFHFNLLKFDRDVLSDSLNLQYLDSNVKPKHLDGPRWLVALQLINPSPYMLADGTKNAQ